MVRCRRGATFTVMAGVTRIGTATRCVTVPVSASWGAPMTVRTGSGVPVSGASTPARSRSRRPLTLG